MKEAQMRMVFDGEGKVWDYSKKRVTDVKGNSRVIFPKSNKDFEEESRLEVMRMELLQTFRNHVRNHCKDAGIQESNLTDGQKRGLEKVKTRMNCHPAHRQEWAVCSDVLGGVHPFW